MRTSKRRAEGYLLIDHRHSPGITEADLLTVPLVRRAEFQVTTGLFESPTIRCCHCGTMVVINPSRTRARGYCALCDHYICDSPICHAACTPFIEQVARHHEQAARRLNIKEI